MQLTTTELKGGFVLCVNICFYPLLKSEYNGKQRILFSVPFDLYEYDQLKDVKHQAMIQIIQHRKKLSIDKDERFVRLVQVPCGYCSECLREKTTSTMFRIMKETESHKSK